MKTNGLGSHCPNREISVSLCLCLPDWSVAALFMNWFSNFFFVRFWIVCRRDLVEVTTSIQGLFLPWGILKEGTVLPLFASGRERRSRCRATLDYAMQSLFCHSVSQPDRQPFRFIVWALPNHNRRIYNWHSNVVNPVTNMLLLPLKS